MAFGMPCAHGSWPARARALGAGLGLHASGSAVAAQAPARAPVAVLVASVCMHAACPTFGQRSTHACMHAHRCTDAARPSHGSLRVLQASPNTNHHNFPTQPAVCKAARPRTCPCRYQHAYRELAKKHPGRAGRACCLLLGRVLVRVPSGEGQAPMHALSRPCRHASLIRQPAARPPPAAPSCSHPHSHLLPRSICAMQLRPKPAHLNPAWLPLSPSPSTPPDTHLNPHPSPQPPPARTPGFRERSETTELIVEISLQPWRSFRPDGVILFRCGAELLQLLQGLVNEGCCSRSQWCSAQGG